MKPQNRHERRKQKLRMFVYELRVMSKEDEKKSLTLKVSVPIEMTLDQILKGVRLKKDKKPIEKDKYNYKLKLINKPKKIQ